MDAFLKVVGVIVLIFGQTKIRSAILQGCVYDSIERVPLRGVNIIIKPLEKYAVTQENGEFSFTGLVAGKYQLVVSHTGYKEKLIDINLAKDTTIEISLVPEVYRLPDVVITATKLPTWILYAPVSSYALRKEDFTKMNPDLLDEVFNFIPGVYLKRAKSISDIMPKVYLRGFEARTIPGPGNRAVVLVDGIPTLDWNRIPTIDIERIEVAKGPYSALYGANAMGGVLNIITRTKLGFKAKLEPGENNTYLFELGASKKFGKLKFYSSFGTHYTGGYISNYKVAYTRSTDDTTIPVVTGFEKSKSPTGDIQYLIGDYGKNWHRDLTGQIRILYEVSRHIVGAKLSISNLNYGYEGGRSWLKTLDGAPCDSGEFRLDDSTKVSISPESFKTTYGGYPIYSANLFFKSLIKEIHISGNASFNQARYWYASPYGYLSANDFERFNFNLTIVKILKERFSMLCGVTNDFITQKNSQHELEDWEDPQSKIKLNYKNSGDNHLNGVFSQLIFKPHKLFTIYLGGRYDLWTSTGCSEYRIGEDSYLTQYQPKQKSAVSHRMGIAFTPLLSSRIYFSYGEAFRPPTQYELYKEWVYFSTLYKGNPNLIPENNRLIESGITHVIRDKLFLSFSWFAGEMENMIATRILDSTEVAEYNKGHGTNFKKIKEKANIASVRINGFEVGLKFTPKNWIKFDFGIGYNDMRVDKNLEESESIGKQLTYVPKITYSGGITITAARVSFALLVRGRSKVYSEPDNSDTVSGVYRSHDPYTFVDMAIRYNIKSNVNSIVKVSNFNRIYYDYYRMPSRCLKAGIEVEF